MTFQSIDHNPGHLTIEYQAEPDLVLQKRQEACQVLRKQKVKVSGFRPGKAPNHVLEQQYRQWIEESITRDLYTSAYQKFLFEKGIKPYGLPDLKLSTLGQNSFYCSWEMYAYPEIKLEKYQDLEFSVTQNVDSPEVIADNLLLRLRNECSSYQDYQADDFVQDGDLVYYSLLAEKVSDDQENDQILRKEENTLKVGEGQDPQYCLNLSEMLSGLSLGQEKTWEAEVANQADEGKTLVRYTVKLISGQKKVLAELNDQLAQRVGLPNFMELEKKITDHAAKFSGQQKKQAMNRAFQQKLLETNPIDLPDWLQRMQILELREDLKNAGSPWEELSSEEQNFYLAQKLEQLKISLLLEKIRDTEPEVNYSDLELLQLLKKKANPETPEGQQMLHTLEHQKPEILAQSLAMLRDEMTLEWLLTKNKLTN